MTNANAQPPSPTAPPQRVEGFDSVVFHYNANRSAASYDFRGSARGYMTAGWWSPTQLKKNILSWKTAVVPEKKPTTFAFIAASSVIPTEFTRANKIKVSVNGKYALTFELGFLHDVTWTEGEYQLKYISKRVEYPYYGAHRQFELSGNSGIYELTVPESAVEAGKPDTIEIEMEPFEPWTHGWFMVKDRKDVVAAMAEPTVTALQGQIATLQRDFNRLNEQTQILGTLAYSKMLHTDMFQHDVIYSNGFRHLHPTDLIHLKNGDILIFTREATEHFAADGDIVMLRSRDGGKTWGDRKVVVGVKDLDEREGCGLQLKDGTILVASYYNNLYLPDGTYDWSGSIRKTDKSGTMRLGAHIIRSTDNGETWTKPEFISTKGMPFTDFEGPTDSPIEMPDGSILMGVIAYGMKDSGQSSVMLHSADKGKTWTYLSTIARDTGGKRGGFLEPGIVRTKSGRIIAAMRNHLTENAIWVSWSDDDGKTWSPVKSTDMIGHPVDLIQLKDGRILATYGVREGVGRHTEPGGIRACFSSDNGETWDIRTEVQLRSDFLNWDIGYPESFQRPDGKIFTAYYFNIFGKYYLGSTVWEAEKK